MQVYAIKAKLDHYEPESWLEFWATLERAEVARQRILDKGFYTDDEVFIETVEVNV